jgi:small-conductance mechanosensitive channel
MRAVVHLVLFACGVVMAVGAFGPFVGVVQARHIRLVDIRDGFATGIPLDGVQAQAAQLRASYTVVLLLVALVMLLAGLFGSRVLGWLAVLAGIAAIAVPAWRLDQRFDRQLRDDYQHLLTGTWGLYLFGGAVVVAVLALLVPGERPRRRAVAAAGQKPAR